MTGTEDPLHTQEDKRYVDFLQSKQISVTYLQLYNYRIDGNGHIMMLEDNSGEIIALIQKLLHKSF